MKMTGALMNVGVRLDVLVFELGSDGSRAPTHHRLLS